NWWASLVSRAWTCSIVKLWSAAATTLARICSRAWVPMSVEDTCRWARLRLQVRPSARHDRRRRQPHRHVQLERKLVPSAEASRVHGTKAKATPAIAANAHDRGQKVDGRCAPSVPRHLLFPSVAWAERAGRVAREAHSQRRTEALYSRYSRPNRPVRYRSSRGTTTRAMMATVASNVATSHRLLTQIARPKCNAKNAR